jgi:hypothetical protein
MRPACRFGLTLAEALVALSVTAMAGTALLLAAETSLAMGDDAVERTIARGLAEQLIDEVMGAAYCEKGVSPLDLGLGRNSWENAGMGRERYTDTDDFTGIRSKPIEDRFGSALGAGNGAGGLRPAGFRVRSTLFTNWRAEIDVYYVSPTNTSQKMAVGLASYYRAVEVRIVKIKGTQTIPLADERRVFSYVPTP